MLWHVVCYGCKFALVVLNLVFNTKPEDWPGTMSLKWPILCQLGPVNQTINQRDICQYREVLSLF